MRSKLRQIFTKKELTLSKNISTEFIEEGYVLRKICDQDSYRNIFDIVEHGIRNSFGGTLPNLEDLHHVIDKKDINKVRVGAYNILNEHTNILDEYYRIFKPYINELIGSDLASQDKINLSIQLPNDETSLVGLHTDTASGQSEFEVVCWLPLTRAYKSNSLYIFNKHKSKEMLSKLPEYKKKGMEDLYQDYANEAGSVEIEPGNCLLFSSTLMHGNRVNLTETTRVSLNFRFKALLSPYNSIEHSEKKIGNFYRPFKISPATKIALDFRDLSGGFR